MEQVKLTTETRATLQYLADNGILSKTNPQKFKRVISSDEIKIIYETPKYRCLFLTISLAQVREATQKIQRVPIDTVKFSVPNNLYTPFLYPIIGLAAEKPKADTPTSKRKSKILPVQKRFLVPTFSYGVERKILQEIMVRGAFLLNKVGLPSNYLSQFLALSSSTIYSQNSGYDQLLTIQGKARFTTVQILQYLKQTNDVEDIIDMWHTGVLPSDYVTFKESFAQAPEEWVEAVYSENVKDYWPETIIR